MKLKTHKNVVLYGIMHMYMVVCKHAKLTTWSWVLGEVGEELTGIPGCFVTSSSPPLVRPVSGGGLLVR